MAADNPQSPSNNSTIGAANANPLSGNSTPPTPSSPVATSALPKAPQTPPMPPSPPKPPAPSNIAQPQNATPTAATPNNMPSGIASASSSASFTPKPTSSSSAPGPVSPNTHVTSNTNLPNSNTTAPLKSSRDNDSLKSTSAATSPKPTAPTPVSSPNNSAPVSPPAPPIPPKPPVAPPPPVPTASPTTPSSPSTPPMAPLNSAQSAPQAPASPASSIPTPANPTAANKPTPSTTMAATPAASTPGITVPPSATQSLSSGSSKGGGGGLMKILGILVFVVVLGLGGYFGYQMLMNRQAVTDSGAVTLTYWGLWEPEEVMRTAIAEYEAAHPNVTIKYINSSPTEYSQRLRNALSADKPTNDSPDLFRMHNTWIYMLKDDLAPLPADIYPEQQYATDFWPVNQNLKIVDYYAIPLMYDGLGLYYNVDIFNTANKQPPTDWGTFQDIAIELTSPEPGSGPIETAGAAMGFAHNVNHWPDILGVLMLQNRADPGNPTNKVAADSLTYYSLFGYRHKTWSSDLPPATQAFATGRLAMMFGPSWEVFNIKKLAQENGAEVDFKIIPVPQLPETNVTWASYWVEGVAKNSPHQREAWQFLKYLSEKETMRGLITEQAKIREFGEIPSRPDLAEEFKDHEYMGPYILQAPAARSHFLTSDTTDENGINAQFIKYYEDALNSTSQGDAPDKVLPIVAQGVQEVMRDFGIGR